MPEFSTRVTAALEAYRSRLAEADTPFGVDPAHAEGHAMEDAIKAADAVALRGKIDLAAEALWDASAPVKAGVRPRWALIKDDPEWYHAATSTRGDVKIVVKTLWTVK